MVSNAAYRAASVTAGSREIGETNPGELVVDPFLGSGTTAIACLVTGRRFLGADVDPGAVSLALERIAAFERGELIVDASIFEDPADSAENGESA